MTYYAAQTITSYCDRNVVYAKCGEPITVIGDGLAMRGDGFRFPCTMERLTKVRPECVENVPKERKQPERRKPLTAAEKLQLEYANKL